MPSISTDIQPYLPLFAPLTTASSIVAPTLTATRPTGAGVAQFTPGGIGSVGVAAPLIAGNCVAVVFTGTRTSGDNETFTARITGWRRAAGSALWIPVPLLTLTGTLGTSVGVAGTVVGAAEYVADTIVVNRAHTAAYEVITPADDTVGCLKLDPAGCEFVQVQLARGTCASCGCLITSY